MKLPRMHKDSMKLYLFIPSCQSRGKYFWIINLDTSLDHSVSCYANSRRFRRRPFMKTLWAWSLYLYGYSEADALASEVGGKHLADVTVSVKINEKVRSQSEDLYCQTDAGGRRASLTQQHTPRVYLFFFFN